VTSTAGRRPLGHMRGSPPGCRGHWRARLAGASTCALRLKCPSHPPVGSRQPHARAVRFEPIPGQVDAVNAVRKRSVRDRGGLVRRCRQPAPHVIGKPGARATQRTASSSAHVGGLPPFRSAQSASSVVNRAIYRWLRWRRTQRRLLASAFRTGQDQRWALSIEGIVGIGAGIATFVSPGLTVLVLVYISAFCALITGLLEILAAFRLRNVIATEWWLILSGALSLLFGIVLPALAFRLRRFLGEGARIVDHFEYTDEVRNDELTILFWKGILDQREISGATVLADEVGGLIRDITVLQRPWGVAANFRDATLRALADVVPLPAWQLDDDKAPPPDPDAGVGQRPGASLPLAPNVAFHGAMLTKTVYGQKNVEAIHKLIDGIQGVRTYLARFTSADRIVEYWNCVIDGHVAQGIDDFKLDDHGRVTDQTVWLRPWPVDTVLRDRAIAGSPLSSLPTTGFFAPSQAICRRAGPRGVDQQASVTFTRSRSLALLARTTGSQCTGAGRRLRYSPAGGASRRRPVSSRRSRIPPGHPRSATRVSSARASSSEPPRVDRYGAGQPIALKTATGSR
jgi:hypothetical protein